MTDATDPAAAVTVADETDVYTTSLHAFGGDSARTGRGNGPNIVTGKSGEQLLVTQSTVGFPLTARFQVPADRLVVAYVHENPAESRWCGVPLQSGPLFVYPPGAEHVGIGQPGTRFTMAVADPERLMSVAERLGLPAEIPRCRSLHEIPASSVTEQMGVLLDRLATPGVGSDMFERSSEQLLAMCAELLSDDVDVHALRPRRGLDSRVIVSACIDYAAATDRIPTIAELCAASNVSERRLRFAFNQEFDRSPIPYFRAWALDRARRRLRDAAPDSHRVSDVACDLGFDHLGRFAGWYKNVYGESPSETLHTAP
jgi:AraC family ethanolamine operon transcriptional activator